MLKLNVPATTIENQAPGKGELLMDRYLSSYIDNQIIRENAFKTHNGYHLQVCDLSDHDRQSLLECMFSKDSATKELLLDRMQDLINERINKVEFSDKYHMGLMPKIDNQTGEIYWIKR